MRIHSSGRTTLIKTIIYFYSISGVRPFDGNELDIILLEDFPDAKKIP